MKPLVWALAALGLSALAGSFPNELRFGTKVNLKVSESQVKAGPIPTLPLDVVLEALARSVGLQPLIYRAFDPTGDPAKAQPPLPNVKLDFQGRPFREVWDLLFATYGAQYNLDYLFLPPDVVVVAPTQVITALVDAPSRAGAMDRRPYIVGIPEIAYKRTESDAQGQTRSVANIEGAKAWVQNDLLPFLSREAVGLNVNWIVVEEGGKLKAILSVLATPEQHARFSDLLRRAGIDFRPLPALAQPKPRVERTYTLTHATFPELLAFLQSRLPEVQINVVPTNPQKALVLATEEDHARLAELLKITDVPKISQRAYQLSNAKAADLAKVLQEALQARKPQAEAQAQPRQATVVADERTNTLIVTGTQEELALVEGLIPKLDQPVPQVNLRVRIQEVQSNLTRNLGLKWNTIAGGNVVASVLDSGLSLIFDSTRSLAALNIVATLDALQRQGLSRALRDVNQTVLNNQTARLQSGETFLIRRVVGDRVERVPFDIGIIVEVTPQITADGQILLNLKAEVSGNVQRNPVDGDVDRFTKQVVTTTLRVRDGETVVLGGLTSQENTQTQQGVPFLMDIPLIGELFKQRTNETTDRELLVVITADILKEAQKP
ncbi:type II secretion system protein GspD [Thermus sp.]|uniref:type II secretion system protein GspD n=1 Tax=Thermus sp. TaxID=275 RepID=UPI003D0C8F20